MSQEIEAWRLVDALNSWELAIEEIGKRFRAGELLPNAGYFRRAEANEQFISTIKQRENDE